MTSAVETRTGTRTSRDARADVVRHVFEAVVLVAVAAGAVLGLRAVTGNHRSAPPAAVKAGHELKAPTNPAIEQAWGIRFTTAIVLADNGLIDLRYVVVNPSTAGRIHSGSQNQPQLPTVRNERTGSQIKPSAAVLHFHHGSTSADGRTYSIVYGNAGDALRSGDMVTVIMKGGLKLEHLQVTN